MPGVWYYDSTRRLVMTRHTLPPSRSRRIAKCIGLVVCVMVLALWVVSTRFIVVRATDRSMITYGNGTLRCTWRKMPWQDTVYFPLTPRGTILSRFGFRLPRLELQPNRTKLSVPLWLLFTLATVPTAMLWHRDRHTVKPGCCRQCGYDLRASKKACPECGTAIGEAK